MSGRSRSPTAPAAAHVASARMPRCASRSRALPWPSATPRWQPSGIRRSTVTSHRATWRSRPSARPGGSAPAAGMSGTRQLVIAPDGAGCPPCSRRGGRGRGSAPEQHDADDRHSAHLTTKSSSPASSPGESDLAVSASKVPPGTALPERYPEVAAQWHPVQNGELTPADFRWASNERAWWLCPTCGHEWSAIIISRTRGGSGCPKCGRRRAGAALGAPKPGQSLAERLPDLAAQWHPTLNGDLTPAVVTAKSGKRAWWLCPECGNEWEAQIGSRAIGYGCKACATQQSAVNFSKPKPSRSLAEQDQSWQASGIPPATVISPRLMSPATAARRRGGCAGAATNGRP